MALKLPKQFHPDFSRPGVKPTGAVEIDWSNPLSKGLQAFWKLQDLRDLIGVRHGTLYGDGYIDVARGYIGDGTQDTMVVGQKPVHSGDITILAAVKFNSVAGTQSIFTADSYNNGKREYQFRIHAGVINFIPFVSNSNGNVTGSTSLSTNTRYVVAATHSSTLASNNCKVYLDGKLDGQGTKAGALDADGANQSIGALLNTTSTSIFLANIIDSLNGCVEFVAAYNRALSASEIAAISRDPYQLLKPAQPMMLFTSAGGGGGTTYDVYASFAFTHGLSQSGSAQAQGGITLSSAVSCDDSATGDYNADTTLSNALTVSNSGLSQAQATAALAASLGYSVDGIIAFFVDVSFATSHSGTFSGTATGQGAISLDASLDQTVSSIAQTIASVIFNTSHGLQNTTGQTIDGAISLGVSAGFQTLGAFTISGNITLNASLATQLNASAQANANLNLGAQIGLSVLAQAAAQAGITLSQVVSVVHTGTSTVFGITTPDGRIYTVEIDTRTLTIEAEDRTYTVN